MSMSYSNLSNKLKALAENVSIDEEDYSIEYEYMPGYTRKDYEATTSTDVTFMVTITDKKSGEVLQSPYTTYEVPLETNRGFVINGTCFSMIPKNNESCNWYIRRIKESDKTIPILELIPQAGYKITVKEKNGEMKVMFGTKKSNDPDRFVNLGIFLKALTGKSFLEIGLKLGRTNSYVLKTLRNEPSRKDCIAITLRALTNIVDNIDSDFQYKELVKRIYDNHYTDCKIPRKRLEKTISFTKRITGEVLARELSYEYEGVKKVLHVNETLTRSTLEEIDKTDIDTIFIKGKDMKIFEIKKYKLPENKDLSEEELFTVCNMFADTLNGLKQEDSAYEVYNRTIEDYDTHVCNEIKDVLVRANIYVRDQFISNKNERGLSYLKLPPVKRDELMKKENSSSIKQTADNINYISLAQNKRQVKIDYSGRTNSNIVSRKSSELGIFSQFHMPESNKIGLLKYRSMTSHLREDGALCGAFCRVKDGKVIDKEPIYLESDEVVSSYVAVWNADLTKDKVPAYYGETVLRVPVSKIQYIEYSPLNNFNECIAFNSFIHHEAGKRIRMGLQDCQAYRCVKSERPIVSSGVIGLDNDGIVRAKDILEYCFDRIRDALTVSISKEDFCKKELHLVSTNMSKPGFRILYFKIVGDIDDEFGTLEYPILYCDIASKNGIQQYSIMSSEGFNYKGDDIVAYRYDFDIKKYDMEYYVALGQQHIKAEDYGIFDVDLSIGYNVWVGFKSTNSTTLDDAMTICEDLRDSGAFTHFHIHREDYELERDERYCEPYAVSVGTVVKPGSPIIFKEVVSKSYSEPPRKSYVRLDATTEGVVLDVRKTGDKVSVTIASEEILSIGDKLSGGHGNKGVVSKILPRSQMPFNSEGKYLQITLNPQGVPSRMNLSQLLEMHLSAAIKKKGENCRVVMTPQFPDSLKVVKDMCKKYNVKAEYFRDGRSGALFDRPIYCGYLYIKKLHHTAKSKSNSCGIPSYTHPVTGQPIKGRKSEGGQTWGEMEMWALLAGNMDKTVNALSSYYSDSIVKYKNNLKDYANSGQWKGALQNPDNNNDNLILGLLRSLCLDLETSVKDGKPYYQMKIMTDDDICKLATKPMENSPSALQAGIKYSDLSMVQTREALSESWNYLNLKHEIINPLWIYKGDICDLINVTEITVKHYKYGDEVVAERMFLNKEKVRDIIDMNNNRKENHKGGYLAIEDGVVYYSNIQNDPDLLEKVTNGRIPKAYLFTNKEWTFGMDVIVAAFRYANFDIARAYYAKKAGPNGSTKKDDRFRYAEKLQTLDYLEEMDMQPSDFIISHLPVIPITFRIPPKKGTADFDLYLRDIINESNKINNATNVFRAVVAYFGLDGKLNERNASKNAKNLCKFFLGLGSEKSDGLLRDNANSKVIGFSFRAAIVPAEAGLIGIGEVGIPFKFTVKCLRIFIEPELIKMYDIIRSLKDDSDFMNELFLNIRNSDIRKLKDTLCLDTMEEAEEEFYKIWDKVNEVARRFPVMVGRQPTLHKFGIRTYIPKVVDGEAIRIHSLVCKGYNADFDGDQEWGVFLIEKSVQEEALRQSCPENDYINPKDGSFILEPTQDTIIGCYMATGLYKNRESIKDDNGNLYEPYKMENCYIYNDLSMMEYDLFYRRVKPYYLAMYVDKDGRRYLSTVGRILLNSKIPEGFTDEPFTNPLKLENINNSNYYQLRFDSQIKKKGKKGCTALSELTSYLYNNPNESYKSQFYKYLNDLFVFAVYICDTTAISIGLDDYIEHPEVDKYKQMAETLVDRIQEEYDLGLCTEKDKKNSVREVYQYCVNHIKSTLLDYYDRDNNLFIMLDSGARGNIDNLNQACGLIGTIAKTNTDVLETAVMSNYLRGLSPSDQTLVSYGTVNGISNVQLNSSKSGEVTRSGVYVLNNLKIVEEDCGNVDNEEEVEYKDEIKQCDAFKEISFDEYSNRSETKSKKLIEKDGKFYENLIDVSVADYINKFKIDKNDENAYLFEKLSPNGDFDSNAAAFVARANLRSLTLVNDTETVTLKFKYELDDMFKELIIDRVGYGLKGMRGYSPIDESGIVTKETIKEIEKEMPKKVRVRNQLNCKSIGGVCAKCYGLEIGKDKLIKVGTSYGIYSVQALSEPITQSNMDSLNREGKGSDQSGAEIAKIRIDGGVPTCTDAEKAVISCENAFVSVETKDDKYAELKIGTNPAKRVLRKNLKVTNGEYVKKGQLIYNGVIDANDISFVGDVHEEIKLKQRSLLRVFYELVKSSDISLNIKNYEALVRYQTSIVRVLSSDDDKFLVGGKYLVQDIDNELKENPDKHIQYYNKVERSADVINCTAGFLSNLTHRSVPEQLAKIALSPSRQYCNNYSEISKVLVGQNLTGDNIKSIVPLNYESVDSINKYSDMDDEVSDAELFSTVNVEDTEGFIDYDIGDILDDIMPDTNPIEEEEELEPSVSESESFTEVAVDKTTEEPKKSKIQTSNSFNSSVSIELDEDDE